MGVVMASIQHRQRADGTVAHRVMFREKAGAGVVSETFDTADQADYFKNLVERIGGAAARAKRAQAEHRQGKTMAEVLDAYTESAPDLSTGTGKEYRAVLCRSGLADITGDVGIDLITREDIEAWVRHRSKTPTKRTKRPPAAKTVANEHGLISTIFAHAVERGWCPTNPAKGVRLPKLNPADPLEITRTQYEAIHTKMDPDYQPLVEFLAVTGVRWGEVTALQWRDITTSTPPRVTVRRAWKKGKKGAWRVEGLPKSDGSHRSFTVPQKLVDKLGDRGAQTDLVFPNKAGTAITHSNFHQRKWVRACEAAEVVDPRPRIHDLRGYFASVMLAAGVPIHVVSRRLGHQNIGTTVRVYGHLTRDAQHAGLDDMEAMLI